MSIALAALNNLLYTKTYHSKPPLVELPQRSRCHAVWTTLCVCVWTCVCVCVYACIYTYVYTEYTIVCVCVLHATHREYTHSQLKGHTATPVSYGLHHISRVGQNLYIHRIWPYIWWCPCQKYRIYTVYIWFWPTLHIRHQAITSTTRYCQSTIAKIEHCQN